MNSLSINLKIHPELDPSFVPAKIWNDAYKAAAQEAKGEKVIISLKQPNGNLFSYSTILLPWSESTRELTIKYVERLVKFLLWQKGGNVITFSGADNIVNPLCENIRSIYSPSGLRSFDNEFIGKTIYGDELKFQTTTLNNAPIASSSPTPLGGKLDGNRIGFDLGGSDRKCAAMIDGKVVYSEEITWDPYFESDPQYHYKGIMDSLQKAAKHLPTVDAIGGSAAGVYVENKVKGGSLFRGVSPEDFKAHIENIFFDIQKEWNNVPFKVVNDGDVTALAGAMSLKSNAVLGISLGTSQAVGYVNEEGHIEPWLNELAFAPVDYREEAPVDEWSGDIGCGVQFFSQQAVNRLLPAAGIQLSDELSFAEKLKEVQALMKDEDPRAISIFKTIGTYLGYSILHYADFYKIRKLLLLGRVTSGTAGNFIIKSAQAVLNQYAPELTVDIVTPSEKDKRHGQAIAAASLPTI